ncbi:extracellular solute-binding protein [Corallincola luteus]|uniref:Extracellular solute-binding protein n=1 Tax=Corallincola luteus TaxID=1775177 RepID=A0ABY2AR13_9GAMM|nr:extracellular solute-binding protein [Corallincola luteus]TCI05461.1 extracellular solute-binding protein [Corallincola luteus]
MANWCFLLLLIGFSSQAVELMLWHQKEEAKLWLPNVAKEYEEKTGVKINVAFLPTGELKTTLVRSVIDGTAPAMALVPSDFIGDRGKLQLSTVDASLLSSAQTSESLATVMFDENYYGVPLQGGNHLLLFYNKKFVQQPAATWQQLITQAKALREINVQPIGWKYGEMYWFCAFIPPFGGFPVADNRVTLDTQAVRDALTFYRNLSREGLIDPNCDYDCSFDRFKNGEFAYAINGDWAFKETASALGDDFGITLLPTINGKPIQPMYGTLSLVYPGYSLNSPAAEAIKGFSSYLQSPEMQQRYYDDLGALPVNEQIVAKIKSSASPEMQILLKQLELARGAPPTPAMSAAWLGMRKGFALFIDGHGSAEEATALMQRFSEHELQKNSQ